MLSNAEAREIAPKLSQAMRDILIEHVDEAAFRGVPYTVHNPARMRGITALMDRGLLRFSGHSKMHPSGTVLTEDGRLVLCTILAVYAEALIAAGYEVEAKKAPTVVGAFLQRLTVERRFERLPDNLQSKTAPVV